MRAGGSHRAPARGRRIRLIDRLVRQPAPQLLREGGGGGGGGRPLGLVGRLVGLIPGGRRGERRESGGEAAHTERQVGVENGDEGGEASALRAHRAGRGGGRWEGGEGGRGGRRSEAGRAHLQELQQQRLRVGGQGDVEAVVPHAPSELVGLDVRGRRHLREQVELAPVRQRVLALQLVQERSSRLAIGRLDEQQVAVDEEGEEQSVELGFERIERAVHPLVQGGVRLVQPH